MITRCPACQTAFRVTDAQLAARNGRVRCGACANIFDAAAYLVANAAFAKSEPAASLAAAPVSDPGYEPFVPDLPDRATTPTPGPEASPAEAEPLIARAAADTAPAVFAASPRTRPAKEASFDFGPGAPAPRRRGAWIAASLLLVLALAAQGLFHFRNDIALLVPEAKPLLKDACTMIGCGISLPRRSELMSIEASDLQADAANPNVVVLTTTLRNRAAFAQAYPALELTLTDSQDLPLARRVLQAGDYLDAPPDNDGGVAAGAERAIKLTLQLTDIKATGYRLYLFYP